MKVISLNSIDNSTVECPDCGKSHYISNVIRGNFQRSTITFVCENKCQEKLLIGIKKGDGTERLCKSKICSLILDVNSDFFSSPSQDVDATLQVIHFMECQNMLYLLGDR